MKTVLLLGAGVTRAARPNIALKRRSPLDADFFEIARAVNRNRTIRVLRSLRRLVGDYADTLSQSLETATTYLYIKAVDASTGSAHHTAFLSLLSLLNEVLARTTNDIPVGTPSLTYRFLLSELSRVEKPEEMAIITFNYDLLLERALHSLALRGHDGAFYFPGCYRLAGVERAPPIRGSDQFASVSYDHNGIAIFKLHGSMNWQSKHTSSRPTSSVLLSPKRELHVLNSTSIPTSLSWRRRRRRVHMKPIITPPVSGKRGMMHRDLVSLWERAGQTLQEANRVVVAGYSCPPLDLEARILLSENMRANRGKRVYVIDPDPVVAARFLELCGVDHITIYTSIADWVRDAKLYPTTSGGRST